MNIFICHNNCCGNILSALFISIVISLAVMSVEGSTNSSLIINRNLAESKSEGTWADKRNQMKALKLDQLAKRIEREPLPSPFEPE